jgi:hypothetical protein
MLINLSDFELSTILKFINKTWREANIIPILKKGKQPNYVSSYRPISLTSNLGKTAERMRNERLYWWLENTKSLNSNQSCFRRYKQTMDQLIRFTQEIRDVYQRKEHAIATFIDLKQTYGRV